MFSPWWKRAKVSCIFYLRTRFPFCPSRQKVTGLLVYFQKSYRYCVSLLIKYHPAETIIFGLQTTQEIANKENSKVETISIHKTHKFNQTFFEKQIT